MKWLHVCRETEEARLVAHVCRELRRKQARLDKAKKPGGAGGPAGIGLGELKPLFPGWTDAALSAKLRERCGCQSLRVRTAS